tara:strand:- start:201 stop:356 length:156 start_codon:yes stop_codon:yes gene_type:complete
MNIAILFVFIGIMLCIISYTKNIAEDNKKVYEKEYINRDLYDELLISSIIR